jgi:hypothetical protein
MSKYRPKSVPGTVQHALYVHIVKKYGSQGAATAAWGCAPSYLSAVLCGKKNISARMLDEMGWEKVVTYRPKVTP